MEVCDEGAEIAGRGGWDGCLFRMLGWILVLGCILRRRTRGGVAIAVIWILVWLRELQALW